MSSRGVLVPELTHKLLLEAETRLPPEVKRALRAAFAREKNKLARLQLKTILENAGLAARSRAPICQDTGFLEFFVEAEGFAGVGKGIRDGVRRATREIPLRPNSVDALSRKPLNANEAIINFVPSKANRLTVFVKGAGCDNKTALFMMPPRGAVEKAVLLFVANNAAQVCPPVFVGVGIGGDAERAIALSKKALLREGASKNRATASLEKRLLKKINALGIGVMGLGGTTTALGVRVETAPTHTACLPVAVSLNCWALRKASTRIKWLK